MNVGRRTRPPWSIARLGALVMALVAYVPALMSSPGRMPSDTKLSLYLDPTRLVADSIWTFDAHQFAGWVPHQMVAYAWPSGPWYVIAETIGLPDWVAHRLWIGTILLAAGTGVAWAARRLGVSAEAAIAAGVLYQLSPYLVPYISRTSSMLLPWAGLGWIVGVTVGAATRTRWRDAAMCALTIGTVGAVNTTALLMIAPAPVLWLAVAAAERTVTPRRALAAALRIGVLSIGTSAWWLAMQVIQGGKGADLLAYSESLEDVSFTATSVEAWRSLGYWLTYIRDPYAPTTTAGRWYMTDTRTIVCGFVLVVVALAGLALTSFAARRFAIAMTFCGLVLAVGVHPFDDPSPIARLLRGDGQEGLSLALRSSTRALPLATFGLALGTAALVDALGGVRWRRILLAAAAAVIAVGNLPVLTERGYVDEALERDEQPPAAWLGAAEALDARPAGYRVLQLPGSEFGAFTWGYTVDPPLPALTERPIVTRDLLPLGSPAAMDLLYALDDRFQEGRPEIAAVAPVARLFGADVIWLTGDAAFDRFRTPRPEVVSSLFDDAAGAPGLGSPVAYGKPVVNAPTVPMVDEQSLSDDTVGTPVPPVELVDVEAPVAILRASDEEVLVAGSGDGLVDAAAAGLIDGTEAIRYSATMDADELADSAGGAALLIVTDSNRRRAHHWRGSQDVNGYTEQADTAATLSDDSGDARLPVFPGAPEAAATVSLQDGPVTAAASGYGDRFSYQPEARPAHAVDGDPNTAWTVLDPTGQYLEVATDTAVDHAVLLQPNGLSNVRHLRTVSVSVDGAAPFEIVLDDRSLVSGQRISFPRTDGPATIRITLGALAGGFPFAVADRTPVGFAEVDLGLGASPEVVVMPTDLTSAMRAEGVDAPLVYVMTRERVRATDRWRADPEWRIARRFEVPVATELDLASGVEAALRLDLRASDSVLAALLGIGGPTSTAHLTGAPAAGGWAAADGDAATAWITPFNEVLGSALDAYMVDPDEPITMRQRGGNYSVVTAVRLTQQGRSFDAAVPAPDDDGVSELPVPGGFESGAVHVEITAVTPRTTRDRRFGDSVVMPAAITEVGNIAPASFPDDFDTGCRDDLVSVDGVSVPVAVSGSVGDALAGEALGVTPCGESSIELSPGSHDVLGQESRRAGLQVDRLVLRPGNRPAHGGARPPAGSAGPSVVVTSSERLSRTVTVGDCPDGCWLILGEGFHPSWAADTASGSLGAPQLLAGGFNGWWIDPSDEPVTVVIRWTAQRPLNVAIAVSLVCAGVCVALAAGDRTRRRASAMPRPGLASPASDGIARSAIAAAAWIALTAGFVGTGSTWWGLAGAAAILVTRRIRIAGLVAVAALVRIAVDVVATVRRDHPPATPGFPWLFEDLHRLGLFAAVALAVSALARRRRRA